MAAFEAPGPYLDPALLAAYYAPDPSSAKAESIVRAAQPAVSDLTELELVAALTRKVQRRELSRRDAQRLRNAFFAHLDAALYARLPLGREHYRKARDWLARREVQLAPRQALHLAVAHSAGRRFATLDPGLAAAAEQVDVSVHPVPLALHGSDEVHEPPAPYGGWKSGG